MIVDLSYDPQNDCIASIGKNGVVGVWDIETGRYVSKVEVGKGRKVKCLSWGFKGEKLVVGTDDGAVICRREGWMVEGKLEDIEDDGSIDDDEDDGGGLGVGIAVRDKEAEKLVTAVAWSRCGRFILTGNDAGIILLWKVEDRKIIARWTSDAGIQKLKWHPNKNAFLTCDTLGQWGITGNVIPAHLLSNEDEKKNVEPSVDDLLNGFESDEDDGRNGPKVLHRAKTDDEKKKRKNGDSESNDDNEDDDATRDGEQADEDGDSQLLDENSLDIGDLEVDDETADRRTGRYDEKASRSKSYSDQSYKKAKRKQRQLGQASSERAQQSFQPSSTPTGRNQKKRILCWNLVGVVTSQDDHVHNTISIDFADSSLRPIRIRDHYQYSMASMTSTGILLASPIIQNQPSVVYFKPFQSWASNSDWTLTLPEGESATCVVLSSRFAAVATSNQLIRVLSLTGIQADVVSIPGRVITLAADTFQLSFVCAANEYSTELLYNNLALNLWNEVEEARSPERHLPISPSSTLQWLGYCTETGVLASYDSNGTVRLKYGPRWIPMLMKAQEVCKCSIFWLAAVTPMGAIGVPCLSNETYPSASTRPALRTVPFTAPVITKNESSVAERLFRARLKEYQVISNKAANEDEDDDSNNEEREEEMEELKMEVEKCVLFLVEECCRNGRGTRALDYVARLRSSVGFEQASRVANHYRMQALAERISVVAKAKMEQIEAEEEERLLKKQEEASSVYRSGAVRSVYDQGKSRADEELSHKATEQISSPARKKRAASQPYRSEEENDNSEFSKREEKEGQTSSQGTKRVRAPKDRFSSEKDTEEDESSSKRIKRSSVRGSKATESASKTQASTKVSAAGKDEAASKVVKQKRKGRRNPFAQPRGASSQATQISGIRR